MGRRDFEPMRLFAETNVADLNSAEAKACIAFLKDNTFVNNKPFWRAAKQLMIMLATLEADRVNAEDHLDAGCFIAGRLVVQSLVCVGDE